MKEFIHNSTKKADFKFTDNKKIERQSIFESLRIALSQLELTFVRKSEVIIVGRLTRNYSLYLFKGNIKSSSSSSSLFLNKTAKQEKQCIISIKKNS